MYDFIDYDFINEQCQQKLEDAGFAGFTLADNFAFEGRLSEDDVITLIKRLMPNEAQCSVLTEIATNLADYWRENFDYGDYAWGCPLDINTEWFNPLIYGVNPVWELSRCIDMAKDYSWFNEVEDDGSYTYAKPIGDCSVEEQMSLWDKFLGEVVEYVQTVQDELREIHDKIMTEIAA